MDRDFRKNHIVSCNPQPNYCVWIRFEDGLEGIVDLKNLVEVPAFAETWKSIEEFNQVRIDPQTQTLTWGKKGEEVDINPSTLRNEILKKRS
jgi:hypothetical protein